MGGGGGGTVNSDPTPNLEAMATIGRERANIWRYQFQPATNKLIGQIRNPAVLARDLDNASKTIGGAFSEARMNTMRNLSRMGVTPTEEQQATLDRQSALAQAGLDAATRMQIRAATRERGTDIIGGL